MSVFLEKCRNSFVDIYVTYLNPSRSIFPESCRQCFVDICFAYLNLSMGALSTGKTILTLWQWEGRYTKSTRLQIVDQPHRAKIVQEKLHLELLLPMHKLELHREVQLHQLCALRPLTEFERRTVQMAVFLLTQCLV